MSNGPAISGAPPHVPLGPALVVVGLSARMLAAAARRAGYAPLAIDLFGDTDLADTSLASRRVGGSVADGPDLDETLAAIDALAEATAVEPAGIVVGSGFEHRPAALEALSGRLPLIAAPPAAVAAVKDPVRLAALADRLGIPHPEIALAPPADPAGWYAKRAGAAGGGHVRPAAEVAGAEVATAADLDAAAGLYFQRRVDGRPLSAAFLADGTTAQLIAVCETHADPVSGAPWRFGGVVGPVPFGPALADRVERALAGIVTATGLAGLCGADLVVDGDRWWLIEINPRPTAALGVLDRGAPPLMALHVAAATGGGIGDWTSPAHPAGSAVLFAPRALAAVPPIAWPAWIADRPAPGTAIGRGDPVVTVTAEASDAKAVAEALAEGKRRAARLVFG